MCGFSGFAGNNCKKEDVLKRMTAKIAHRGPDQEGVFLSEKAALGFRRLSIIDLNNGSQPMYNEDGKIVITFNGEIYNHLELRKELIEKGHVFENNSDTECLIHGYEEYGTDLLYRLRGMFAFVIYDSNRICYSVQGISSELNHSIMERHRMGIWYSVRKSRVFWNIRI